MPYATYDYYTKEYGGSAITEDEFQKYAKKASAEVDHVTFGRVQAMSEDQIPDAVRDAVCEVAEKLHHYATAEGSRIASENNDGYSVSYRDTGSTDEQMREIWATIRTYLAITGLMYRGFSHGVC